MSDGVLVSRFGKGPPTDKVFCGEDGVLHGYNIYPCWCGQSHSDSTYPSPPRWAVEANERALINAAGLRERIWEQQK